MNHYPARLAAVGLSLAAGTTALDADALQPLGSSVATVRVQRLAVRDSRYRTAMTTVAVADVQGYGYWPVKGFVKDAVRSESKKRGTPIYCDWDGYFRARAGVTARNEQRAFLRTGRAPSLREVRSALRRGDSKDGVFAEVGDRTLKTLVAAP